MANFQPKGLRRRSLLADVLPFELPVIFTNDFLFASTLALKVDLQTAQAIALLRSHDGFTIPYDYEIIKDRGRVTRLSIIHPIVQLKWADFIDHYAETILAYCGKGDISLRHPFAIVSQRASAPLEAEATARDGLPHELLEEHTPDFSRMASYFRLRRFNILSKFFEDRELLELEKKFSHQLSLDISKCFYNIYTHSISWAVKGKPFSKTQLGSSSFEDKFDNLMQIANYKETNGIVVGPEVSRIFAEIILQAVDKEIVSILSSKQISSDSYAIRRYVDDYFIFGNSQQIVEEIERCLATVLGNYKLFLNGDKRELSLRPFVSPISRLKNEITKTLDDVAKSVKLAATTPGFCDHKAVAIEVRRKLKDIRIAVSPAEVGFHNVSGWLMWKVRRIVREATTFLVAGQNDDARDCAGQILSALFDLAFYVAALDFRVRTGFNLAVLVTTLLKALEYETHEQSEWLQNFVFEELMELHKTTSANRDVNSVEVCNLLLTGSHAFGERFVRHQAVKKSIFLLANTRGDYRAYITAKFCMLRDKEFYSDQLKLLNDLTKSFLCENVKNFRTHTETYLIFCDYISAPDISNLEKSTLIDLALAEEAKVGKIGPISEIATIELSKLLAFVDWSGVRLQHTLRRRQLRAGREY